MRERALQYSLILPVVARTAVNALERERVEALERRVRAAFGAPGLGQRALRLAARAAAARWRWRVRLAGDGIQPRTMTTRYPAGGSVPVAASQGAEVATAAAPSRVGSRPARIPSDLEIARVAGEGAGLESPSIPLCQRGKVQAPPVPKRE